MKIFRGISELYTFQGVAKKDGRGQLNEKDLSTVKNAALVVSKGKIVWLGPVTKLPPLYFDASEVDLGGRQVIPGLIDCHTHLLCAGNRANELELRNQGVSYQDITARGGGIYSTVKSTRACRDAQLIQLTEKRLNILALQGVAAVEIKTGYGLTIRDEMRLLKLITEFTRKNIRVVPTFLGAHAIPRGQTEKSYLSELIALLPRVRKLTKRLDIFIEKNFFTVENCKPYLQKAKELGFEICVHANQLSESGGAELALELEAISAEHLIHLRAETIASLGQSSTVCVLLPAADLYLKCPYPPARKLLDAGAAVALATDFNPGSSPVLDVQLVGMLARVEMQMTLLEVLAAWTWNGARALGLQHEHGSLEVGKAACFCVLQASWDELFYEMRPGQVWKSFVNGKAVPQIF